MIELVYNCHGRVVVLALPDFEAITVELMTVSNEAIEGAL